MSTCENCRCKVEATYAVKVKKGGDIIRLKVCKTCHEAEYQKGE